MLGWAVQEKVKELNAMTALTKKASDEGKPEVETPAKKEKKKKKKKNEKSKASAKKKPSLKSKASTKTKPSLKNKPSIAVKQMKKKMKKNLTQYEGGKWKALKKSLLHEIVQDEIRGALLATFSAGIAGLMKKTAEAQAGGIAETIAAASEEQAFAELQLEGVKVVLDDEAVGKQRFGRVGVVSEVEGTEAVVKFDGIAPFKVELAHLTAQDEFKNLNSLWKRPNLNACSRPMCRKILETVGYRVPGTCDGDVVQLEESAAGKDIFSMNLHASFVWWKMGMEALPPADLQCKVECIDPDLFKAWMVSLQGPAEDAEASFKEEFFKAQAHRQAVLKTLVDSPGLVLLPVHFKDHWTLVQIVNGKALEERRVEYKDSLTDDTFVEEMWSWAAGGLELLGVKVPRRSNLARQVVASNTCGAFVLHYMEVACRRFVLNEPRSAAGYPEAKAWGGTVQKIAAMLLKEQNKLKDEESQAEVKMKKVEEKKKKMEEAKKKKEVVDGKLEALSEEAAAQIQKIPPGKPCLENLSEQGQAAVKLAALGAGSCSRCRWANGGCLSCSGAKALQYWLNKEGFVQQTMKMPVPAAVEEKKKASSSKP